MLRSQTTKMAESNLILKDESSYTALHRAAKDNKESTLKLLLLKGSHHVNARGDYDWTPLHFAAEYNRGDSHYSTIEILLKNGADVNAQVIGGKTPLHYLVRRASVKTIQLLLNFKPDLNIRDVDGKISLFDAIFYKNVEAARILIDHGSDVNSVNLSNGETPLHEICYWKNLKIIKFLVEMGADVDALDYNTRTPLMVLLDEYIKPEKILNFFLKYSDVNTLSSNERYVSKLTEVAFDRKIILKHLAKLQALDMSLEPVILESVSKKEGLYDYFLQCTNELALAKTTKPKDMWVTYFNLLVDNKRKLKNYAGNKSLIKSFYKTNCLSKFPIYGDEMHKNVDEGIKRRELFDKSSIRLSDCWPIFNPNHLIIRDVLDCVTKNDLSMLCVSKNKRKL